MSNLHNAASSRAAPPPDLQAAQMRKDKMEAVRLARLKVKANARGAAPPPPGKGGSAPAPVVNTTDGAPPKVNKYRAVEDHTGEISFESGATIFVLGDPDASGNVMGVVNGASGNIPFSKLVVITDELLEQERKAKDAAAEANRKAKEENLKKGQSKLEEEAAAKLEALDAKEKEVLLASQPDGLTDEQKMAAAARAQAEAKLKEETDALYEEEMRLKAEAARLEELMRQLDMSDDEE